MVSGIYRISLTDGRCYVGQTRNFPKRWHAHRKRLGLGTHHSAHLQNAWAKYGADAFTFSVLERCDPSQLTAREQAWFDQLRPAFNILLVAGSNAGWTHSAATRARMSLAHTGKVKSAEHLRKLSAAARVAQLGNQNARGHILPPESLARIVAANRGRVAWNRGLSPTEETRRKISVAHTGLRKGQRVGQAALNVAKTHCPHGHPYEGDNVYVTKAGFRQMHRL
jgi:group I intron endonuclease